MNDGAKRTQTWVATKVPNLFILKESGTYYGRVKLEGASYRKSLETTSFNVAKAALRDWLLAFKQPAQDGSTLGSMVEPYFGWLAGEVLKGKITKSTVEYKTELLDSVRGWTAPNPKPGLPFVAHPGTWPGFNPFKLEKLSEDVLATWLLKHRKAYSATRTNGAVTVIREIGDLAVRKKFLAEDPWERAKKSLGYVKVTHSQLTLPEPSQVQQLRQEVYLRSNRHGTFGAWTFDFLLFSGARIESAREACWEDVKWSEGQIYFRKAKRGAYYIPLFPQLKELLQKIQAQRQPAPEDRILPTASLAKVLTSACKSLAGQGVPHLSHHDLRHLFATRCIESGVDIPTVSRWLGHKDGGALAMKTYGHLRQTHSQQQAATVDFLPKPQQKESKRETQPPAPAVS